MAQVSRTSRKPTDVDAKRTRRRVADAPRPARLVRLGYVVAFATGAGLGVAVCLATQRPKPSLPSPVTEAPKTPASYYELLAMPSDELGRVDLAVMNLLCAKGLPGTENLDIPAALAKLDEWARKVGLETNRHLYRVTDPRYAEHYKHSEARLRAEFIVQCLQEECGVHYNLDRVRNVDFSRPQDLFIHGLVNSDNGGTCSSMPVLYAAIGRRLGYPIKLALAKQHVFCRWDDGKERFNIDGAGNGGVDYPADEFYRTWPVRMSDAEFSSGEFLKALTPREELASFLLQRSCCWKAHRQAAEERACLAEALRLMPQSVTLQDALLAASPKRVRTAGPVAPWQNVSLPMDIRRQLAPPADPTPGVPYNTPGGIR